MTRRMGRGRRASIFAAHNGICHICGEAIDGTRERWDADHIVPYALTRDDSDANLAPAHERCHAKKTPDDVRQIAKAKRVQAKHIGAKKAKRPLPGSQDSQWKAKVGGGWERREG